MHMLVCRFKFVFVFTELIPFWTYQSRLLYLQINCAMFHLQSNITRSSIQVWCVHVLQQLLLYAEQSLDWFIYIWPHKWKGALGDPRIHYYQILIYPLKQY